MTTTVSISPRGEITITQESAEERAFMNDVYFPKDVKSDGALEKSQETVKDEQNEAWFKSGWAAAVGTADVAYQAGELDEFFSTNIEGWESPDAPFVPANQHEAELHDRAKRANDLKKPWHAEYPADVPVEQPERVHVGYDEDNNPLFQKPDGTLTYDGEPKVQVIQPQSTFEEQKALRERWEAEKNPDGILHPGAESHEIHGVAIDVDSSIPAEAIHLAGSGIITPAEGPGEPEFADAEPTLEGAYTIPADELQSIRDEEYRRGRADGIEAGVNVNKTISWQGVQNAINELVQSRVREQYGDGPVPIGTQVPINSDEVIRHILEYVGYTILR